MTNSAAHEEAFDEMMEDYSFILSISGWSTADLIHMAGIIDVELQRRYADETLDDDEDYETWMAAQDEWEAEHTADAD